MKSIDMRNLIVMMVFVVSVSASCAQNSSSEEEVSLDTKIGQMIMVGYPGTSLAPNDLIIDEIKSGNIGGVILFEKNIGELNPITNLRELITDLQTPAGVPLFMAIDQEGGTVNRLKSKYGFPESVTAAYLGDLDNEDSTRFYGQQTAATLSDLGFNVNFAPVLDLASNPDNPIIAKYGRAYSADAEMVTKHAGITIEEHNKQNIITVGKHFPGHGSSQADTHLGIADVTETWDKLELTPYEALIKANKLPGVMSAHIVNKNLEPEGLPGTLSRRVLQGILREDLQFKGVVFSDDMQMHAITEHYGLEKSIELGINAGLDVIIFSNNIQSSEDRTVGLVHGIMKKMVEDGTISQSRIDESYARIMKLKGEYLND
jgi:beta-N-acetylhexosaminidase